MTVFASLYANQYDQLYAEKSYGAECDLIEEAVRRFSATPPRSVLDVGCGTGSHAIELARRGYRTTGVDLSAAMLEQAAEKSASLEAGQRPAWICGDARSFDTGERFDLGIMMFAVIGYMTTNDDVLGALRNIRRQLAPGAVFVCDFWYGPSVLSVRPTDRVRVLDLPDGKIIRAASTTLDVAQHTADVSFRLWTLRSDRLASETSETHRMRYFFPREFDLLLEVSGFRLKSMSAFPSLDVTLTNETWNALVVAEAV